MPKLGDRIPTPEETHERRMDFLERRKRHQSYQTIADVWGVSAVFVYAEVKRVLDKVIKEETESAEEVRTLELQRLDRLAAFLEPMVMRENPHLDYSELYLKVMGRRARLLGLDAAQKHEVAVVDKRRPSISDAELYAKIRAMHERIFVATGVRHKMLDERNPFEALGIENASDVVEGEVVSNTAADQKLSDNAEKSS